MLTRIKEEEKLINAFKDKIPEKSKEIEPISSEFAKQCFEKMFTEDHVMHNREKLYYEIFELWQLFQLAQKAKSEGEKTYYITVNDKRRLIPEERGSYTQVM
ncbi:unnamed protein product, partial [marine sediment metagenome]